MKATQTKWTPADGWAPGPPLDWPARAQLVLVFGSPDCLRNPEPLDELRRNFPDARIVGCSTAGEISGTRVIDDTLVATAIHFAHTRLQAVSVHLRECAGSFAAGVQLASALADPVATDSLAHVLVLSDGLHVNGSQLVQGLSSRLPTGVTVTGGLAGDGARFGETLVVSDGTVAAERVVAVGFYGARFRVGYGSLGGWDPFGPERVITRARGNVLYELDGQSALALYRQYLGDHAAGLPATGLLYPLSLRVQVDGPAVVRTILGIDEAAQSMTFAGDMPEGTYARLMKANFDRLIDGAVGAATTSRRALGSLRPELAILISCVGRKLVLKQRVEEEVEGVRDIVGPDAVLAGFYSYGEISPFTPTARCELHNQTMTVTVLTEE